MVTTECPPYTHTHNPTYRSSGRYPTQNGSGMLSTLLRTLKYLHHTATACLTRIYNSRTHTRVHIRQPGQPGEVWQGRQLVRAEVEVPAAVTTPAGMTHTRATPTTTAHCART
jgi:hypothetical protein